MIEESRFTMRDGGFVCSVCSKTVPPLGYTARDHCPYCLFSLHLDVNPGDRSSDCGGILKPVGVRMHKKGWQILYRCEKCGAERKNIAAKDDDAEAVIRVSAGADSL